MTIYLPAQVQNWCQCMCLNQCRQQRRLRKGLEDWRNLLDHAYAADASQGFIDYIIKMNWKWSPQQTDGGVQLPQVTTMGILALFIIGSCHWSREKVGNKISLVSILNKSWSCVCQSPLMTWIELECCSSMILHLLLGCELDLYNNNQLLMVFW